MMANGIAILPVMQAGGWRSMNIVERYVQNASVEQNGIAQLFDRVGATSKNPNRKIKRL